MTRDKKSESGAPRRINCSFEQWNEQIVEMTENFRSDLADGLVPVHEGVQHSQTRLMSERSERKFSVISTICSFTARKSS